MTTEEREDMNTFKHDLVKQARWWQWKAETLEKENEQLKAENTALKERLDKAIEPPCERDDIFYRFFQYPAEMVEDIACGFRKEKDGELYVCSANSESWYNVKECEFSREAAEARLKELQGGKK